MSSESAVDQIAVLNQAIVSMAIESWRIARVFDRMILKLDAGEKARYQSQFRWYLKKTEDTLAGAGLTIINVEGQLFDPGMAATPVNIGEFAPDDHLIVDQMIEPIIMGKEGIVRAGSIVLRKAEV